MTTNIGSSFALQGMVRGTVYFTRTRSMKWDGLMYRIKLLISSQLFLMCFSVQKKKEKKQ